ncbi:Sorting nexin-41 [Penicillium macrosclerotiorum]|uniref:Sorting nexin-41 n=1 Tax=Penicillium macrosclerotiorum TaxID=303699 RepID=UPI0025477207|nr:Sorting nexin-41 [Penicillium macrosclerotiorum]KAJ5668652.1 Sorting nexin-41 [Penicillium macrosclerotiorum]
MSESESHAGWFYGSIGASAAPLRHRLLQPTVVGDVEVPPQIPRHSFPSFNPEGFLSQVPGPSETSNIMWNDEDNNPYGAFDHHESRLSDSLHSAAISPPLYEHDSTPPSSRDSNLDPPDFISHPEDLSDPEEAEYGAASEQYPRKSVYDSRIEQILYENPEMPILITDAGKNHEGGGSFIVYTIRTAKPHQDLEVRRRYSEFASLRQTLVNLHPTLIVPPIPEKHSMADYAAKPTKAKEDTAIIELRKRMLAVFLNRCRRMKEIREDGVWWRFLDPNVSWSEVLHSHPASSIPKNNLKAPPLDPANPTQAHGWLPVPSSSAKLKSSGGFPSSPTSPGETTDGPAPPIPGPEILGRFPPESRKLSEQELDPYFVNFEASTRELELLLQGNIEKVNRRTLSHLSSLSADLMELGARYNGFSLSEQSPTVAAAIERIGQAADTSYIETEELSSALSASFAEPMRESAQFASVVRGVLRYRVLKRVQEDMTRDELAKKKTLLDSLERSELEAKRIEQYLNRTGPQSGGTKPRRSLSTSSAVSSEGEVRSKTPLNRNFRLRTANLSPVTSPAHRKTSSGTFVANKIFGRISHAIHGFADVDPERTRRDQIGKTKESLIQLEQALEVSEKDVKDASTGVLQDLRRFQKDKEADLRRYMVAYARCHLDWARKNLETWTEAKDEVDKIVARYHSIFSSSFRVVVLHIAPIVAITSDGAPPTTPSVVRFASCILARAETIALCERQCNPANPMPTTMIDPEPRTVRSGTTRASDRIEDPEIRPATVVDGGQISENLSALRQSGDTVG